MWEALSTQTNSHGCPSIGPPEPQLLPISDFSIPNMPFFPGYLMSPVLHTSPFLSYSPNPRQEADPQIPDLSTKAQIWAKIQTPWWWGSLFSCSLNPSPTFFKLEFVSLKGGGWQELQNVKLFFSREYGRNRKWGRNKPILNFQRRQPGYWIRGAPTSFLSFFPLAWYYSYTQSSRVCLKLAPSHCKCCELKPRVLPLIQWDRHSTTSEKHRYLLLLSISLGNV